ncbi:hypothetical protein L1987_81230 [Smallanthus sonchifolius]|uniref:Uncharacterized protein n=1 Tax=Smallanthus sonchifolius TaxID=185202 RepID=A0ACB8YQH0_9ASTR|nr:hypothetical protein L1987_81230 [Smallanthus sonchifolius]
MDLRVHQGSPLVDCGLECELTCCVMVPVFDGASSECVGVVECSMKHPAHLLPIFNELKRELERKGLKIYHAQGSWPYKAIQGDLEPVKVEIEKGLKMVCESHDLILGQAWISYECENDNHAQMFLVKLSGYSVDNPLLSSVKAFYNKFDVIPLKTGEGLVLKTLQTHQPHVCRNIYKMSDNRGVSALLSANTKCTSLVICLRSTHTRELDYAFEFFWPCKLIHV